MVPQLTSLQWLRSIWSEPTGTGSNSRINATLVTVAALGMVLLAMLTLRDIPAGAQVVLLSLLGASAAAYGVNKVAAATTKSTPSSTGDAS